MRNDTVIHIEKLLTPRRVICELRAGRKHDVFTALAARLSLEGGPDEETVLAALRAAPPHLMLRGGLSLIHILIDELDHPVAFVARLRRPLRLSDTDQCATDLIALLASPCTMAGEHLRALACLARRLRRADVLAAMRSTRCPDVMYLALTSDECRDSQCA